MENNPNYHKLKLSGQTNQNIVSDQEYCNVFGIPTLFEYTGKIERFMSRCTFDDDGNKIQHISEHETTKNIIPQQNILIKKKTYLLSQDYYTNLRHLYLKYNCLGAILNISIYFGGNIYISLNRFDILKLYNKFDTNDIIQLELLGSNFIIPMPNIKYHEVGVVIYYSHFDDLSFDIYEKIEQPINPEVTMERTEFTVQFNYEHDTDIVITQSGMICRINFLSCPPLALNKPMIDKQNLYFGLIKTDPFGNVTYLNK